MTLDELAHALGSRSKYRSVLTRRKLPRNPQLTKSIGAMVAAATLRSLSARAQPQPMIVKR